MASVNEITIGITGKTKGLETAVAKAKAEVKGLEAQTKESGAAIENAFSGMGTGAELAAGFIGGMVSGGVLAAVELLCTGLTTAVGLARDMAGAAFQAAVETENWASRMDMLVGSGDEAKRVLGDIIDFSKDAPIAVGKLVEGAERMLTLTGDSAFSTVNTMRQLADLAVFTNNTFDGTAEKVGLFFQSLKAGETTGVAALKSAGLVTGEFAGKLDDLVKRHGTVREAWALFIEDTERARGAMEKQRDTWDGSLQEMKNLAHDLAKEIGQPFLNEAKIGLRQVIEWIKGPDGKEAMSQLKALAQEGGKMARAIGPELFKLGTDGIKALLHLLSSDLMKGAIGQVLNLAEAAIKLADAIAKLSLGGGGSPGGSAFPNGFQSPRPRIQIDTSRLPSGWKQATGFGEIAVNPFGGANPFGPGSTGVGAQGELQGPERIGKAIATALLGATGGGGKSQASGLVKADPGDKRLGTEPKPTRPPRMRSGGRTKADAEDWGGMLDSWLDAIFDEAYRHAQDWGRLTEDLTRKTMLLAGASKEQMLAFELTKGSLKDSTNKDLEEQSAKLDWAIEAKARRKDMIEQLRDQARETGSLALVEETLSKAEMTQSKMLFTAYTARARHTLAMEHGKEIAKSMIETYREELGLLPKITEAGKALAALMKPENKDVSVKDRFKILGLASDLDGKHARDAMKGFIEDLEQQLGVEKKITHEHILREAIRNKQFQGDWKTFMKAMTLAKAADGTLGGGDGSRDGLNSVIGMSKDAFSEMQRMQGIVENGANRMADVLIDSFLRIGEGADSMFENLIGGFRGVLADMAAEFLQSQIKGLLFSLLGGRRGLSDASSGGGQSMVSGRLSDAVGGRAPVVVNMPVYVQDPGGLKKSMGQIQQEAFAKAAEASRRNG